MAALLQAGQTYNINVRITNTSTKAGTPVSAELSLGVTVTVGGEEIGHTAQTDMYGASEQKEYVIPITMPQDSGGQTGQIVAAVTDPGGNQIGQGSLDLVIEGSTPFDIVPVGATMETCKYATAYWVAEITWRVTNNTGQSVTRQLRCSCCRPGQQDENDINSYIWAKYWRGSQSGDPQVWLEVTLGPGESMEIVSPYYYLANGYEACNLSMSYHGGVPIRLAFVIFDQENNWSEPAYVGSYP